MSVINNNKLRRFHELDIFRFLAALSVVFFHYTVAYNDRFPQISAYPEINGITRFGYLGVEFFFMISGFVILLTASRKDWQGFLISRIVRLFPAFWLSVTFSALVLMWFSSELLPVTLSQYTWNMTMLAGFFGVPLIDDVYWTLEIELAFYFWIWLILFFNKISHIENFVILWLFLSVLGIYYSASDHAVMGRVLISDKAPFFSAGVLFFIIHSQGVNLKRTVLVLLSYVLSLYFALDDGVHRVQGLSMDFSPIIIGGLITLFYVLFILIIMGKTRSINHHWLTFLGATTYPLYLIHSTIGEVAYLSVGDSINKYVFLVIIVISMIAIAYLIHRFIEIRFAKMMKRKLDSWNETLKLIVKKRKLSNPNPQIEIR